MAETKISFITLDVALNPRQNYRKVGHARRETITTDILLHFTQ